MKPLEQHYAVSVLVERSGNNLEEVEAAITNGRVTDADWARIRADGKTLLETDPPKDPRFAAVLAATAQNTIHIFTPDEYLEFMDYLREIGWGFRSRYYNVIVPFVEQEDQLPQQVEELKRRGVTMGTFEKRELLTILNDGVNRGWDMQREYLKQQNPENAD